MRVGDRKEYFGIARFCGAGPLRMRPAVSYCEPWQWQSQPPYSPCGEVGVDTVGVQPRWVQTPISTSHCGLMARLASVAGALSGRASLLASGSGSELTSTALADAI